MSDDPAKQAWQSSVEIAGAPPLEEVRAGADKFYRFVRRRNFVEYAACVLVVAIFGWFVFIMPHPLQRIGAALIVLATLYVARQVHRRISAEPPPEMAAGAVPIYAFLRAQFVRQRDALRSIFWWYILPFLPGAVVMNVGSLLAPDGPPGGPGVREWLAFAGMAAIVAGIWWLNQRAAAKLQAHIDEIDALTGGNE